MFRGQNLTQQSSLAPSLTIFDLLPESGWDFFVISYVSWRLVYLGAGDILVCYLCFCGMVECRGRKADNGDGSLEFGAKLNNGEESCLGIQCWIHGHGTTPPLKESYQLLFHHNLPLNVVITH